MAFRCGFFNSVAGDRKYNADDMCYPYKEIVSDGVLAKTDDSDAFQVVATAGFIITVKKGFGKFFNKWAVLDEDMTFQLAVTPASARIDSVIVRIDNSDSVRAGSIEILRGTPSANPVPPTLTRTSTVMEYRLANVYLDYKNSYLSQANITDTRPTSECGFVTNLLQNSDITATYRQWEAQFKDWLESQQTDFEDWLSSVRYTSTTIIPLSVTEQTVYSGEEEQTTFSFSNIKWMRGTDIFDVYVNGMKLRKDSYSVSMSSSLILRLDTPVSNRAEVTVRVWHVMGNDTDVEELWDNIRG